MSIHPAQVEKAFKVLDSAFGKSPGRLNWNRSVDDFEQMCTEHVLSLNCNEDGRRAKESGTISDSESTSSSDHEAEISNKEDLASKIERAELAASQLIDEEESLTKKQEKRREKKKKKKKKNKQSQNQDAVANSEVSQPSHSPSSNNSSRKLQDVKIKSQKTANLTEAEPESKHSNKMEKESTASTIAEGYTFGRQGNFRAEMGQFDDAIKCYTKALQFLPNDSKLYGNRSCCYEKLKKYDKALADANKAIDLDSGLPMNYFRKGLALSGLKRYREAEQEFKMILKLDPQCCIPIRELMLLRKAELMEMGFDEKQAYSAACMYKTVQEAINGILENNVPDDPLDIIFMSDEEDDDASDYEEPKVPVPKTTTVRKPNKDVIKDSPIITNVKETSFTDVSVWVGNILTSVDNADINRIFSKYGDVRSINVLRKTVVDDCYCGFVVYKDSSSVAKAIVGLNGYCLNGKNLIVRLPNKPAVIESDASTKLKEEGTKKKVKPVNGECYYWRTVGTCRNANTCNFKHVPEHRLIDRK